MQDFPSWGVSIGERTGFHIGGSDIGLSKNGVWRFQPALQFTQKGWKFDGYFAAIIDGNWFICLFLFKLLLFFNDLKSLGEIAV